VERTTLLPWGNLLKLRERIRPIGRRTLGALRLVAERAPISARGLLVLALSVVALQAYGFGSLDLLLFVIGVSGLVLTGVAMLVTTGSAIHLARAARTATSDLKTLECGSPLRTGFRLPGLAWLPLVQISWTWRHPVDVTVEPRLLGPTLWEEVVAQSRTLESGVVRRISVQDAFGLSRIVWPISEPVEVTLRPRVGGLRRAPLVPSFSGADGVPNPAGSPEGDRMEIRRYVPGDAARHIMWSWFAKTRQLVVRTPERSLDRSQRVIAYLVAGAGDEPASAAARVALEERLLGDSWCFGADGDPGTYETLEPAMRAVCRSGARGGGMPACRLSEFVRENSKSSTTHCVVFAPARPGPWTQIALELLRERRGGLSFVLGTDGISRPRRREMWLRLLTIEDPVEGAPHEEVSGLTAQLVRAGAKVIIADRLTGRYYEEGRRSALEATG